MKKKKEEIETNSNIHLETYVSHDYHVFIRYYW